MFEKPSAILKSELIRINERRSSSNPLLAELQIREFDQKSSESNKNRLNVELCMLKNKRVNVVKS